MLPRKRRIIFKCSKKNNKAKHNFNPKISLYWQIQFDEMFSKWRDTND